jgi:alpha-glucoside transport system substrate-binding protein
MPSSGQRTTDARRRRLAAAIAVLCGLGPVASSDSSASTDRPVVTVFGSLTGADADAFVASLRPFEAREGIDVRYVGSSNFEADLVERVRRGDPPDLALLPQPGLLMSLAADGFALPYDGDLAEAAVHDVDPWLVGLVALDGRSYGSWYSVDPKSLVWYSPRQFRVRGLQVPTTWDDLIALTDDIAASGTAPWCLGVRDGGATGWVATDWVEDLVLRTAGADIYDAWVTHDIEFTDRRIATAVDRFGSIALDARRVSGGNRAAVELTVTDAARGLLGKQPSCLMHRQAVFLPDLLGAAGANLDISPDGDLWVFPFPGDADSPSTMLVGGTVVGRVSDRPEVRSLAAYLTTLEAAAARAKGGGFVSALDSFDPANYPSELNHTVAEWTRDAEVLRFDASDLMPPEVGVRAFWAGMTAWLGGARLATTLAEIDAAWPVVAAVPYGYDDRGSSEG